MSSSYSAQTTQLPQQSTQQPIYPPRYPNNNHISANTQTQSSNRNYPYPAQSQQQYPPNNYQQQPYYQQSPHQYQQSPHQYQQYPPNVNNPYPQQQTYNPHYTQQSINPQQQYNPDTAPPPPIPQSSPLLRHPLSQIISMIGKNKQQFSQDFNKKFKDNEDFRSLNRKIVFLPSMLIISHVILNRKKKWFRLTVNAPLIRYSLLGLFMLHISTNVLYVAGFRDLIARNRDKIEKVVVREEFLGSSNK